jgi:phosphatidate cytidylyltransferase
MTSHTKRVLTSLVLILVLGYFIFWASPLELALGALVLSGMGLWEFFSLFWPGSQRVWLKCGGIVLAVPLVMHNFLGMPALGAVLFSLWAMNAIFLVQFGRGRSEIDWQGLQIVSLGLLYIPLALQFLIGLAAKEILLVLLSAFATDIFAYYFGSWWGKRKMWPAVSPKKTWIGAGGGVLGCLAVSLAFGLSVGTAPWPVWIVLGVALNIAAQLGDFFLSALKRRQEVKDSGKLLPGHGGFLDRFDSVLLVLPAYMFFQFLYPLF